MTQPPAYQVTHHRPDDNDPDRRLEGLSGPSSKGGLWYGDIDTLIAAIKNRTYDLWTIDQAGNSVWVEVKARNGREYLKTESDGIEPNNLLALPRC